VAKHLSLRASGLLLALLALFAAAPAFAGEASPAPEDEAARAPRVEFDEITFDFGTMYQQEEVSQSFVFRNVGAVPLKILNVRSTCGCTAALPDKRELAVGEEASIKTTFRSGAMRNRVTKHVYVDTNDPAQPRVTLTITGEIKVEIKVSPRGIYIGKLNLGETMYRTIELIPVDVADFSILEVSANDPAVRVDKPVRLKGENQGYRLTVHFGPAKEPGRVSAKITVLTDLPHTKELRISVYGKVVEPERPAESADTN